MTKDEQKELLEKAKEGCTESKDAFISYNLRLVAYILKRYKHIPNYSKDREDLFQIGCIALIGAFERFDLSKENQFATYAVLCIDGAIRKSFSREGIIRTPRKLQDISREINKYKKTLNYEPSLEEIALAISRNKEEVAQALLSEKPIMSLEMPIGEEKDNLILADMIALRDDSMFSVDNILLHQAINRLPEQEQQVIRSRYLDEKTQREVAVLLNRSQAHISRTERHARNMLKLFLQENSEQCAHI